jgi:hypothetical protein
MDLTELLTGTDMSLELVIWSMFAGIVAASFMAVYNRRVTGKIVRILYSHDAHSPNAALTLADMGLSRNIFVRWSLRKNGVLRKVVFDFDPFAGNSKLRAVMQKNHRRDLNRLRFYIPPEADERAEMMYIREGTTIFTALLSVALFLAIVLFCLAVIPGLQDLLSNLSLVIDEYFG